MEGPRTPEGKLRKLGDIRKRVMMLVNIEYQMTEGRKKWEKDLGCAPVQVRNLMDDCDKLAKIYVLEAIQELDKMYKNCNILPSYNKEQLLIELGISKRRGPHVEEEERIQQEASERQKKWAVYHKEGVQGPVKETSTEEDKSEGGSKGPGGDEGGGPGPVPCGGAEALPGADNINRNPIHDSGGGGSASECQGRQAGIDSGGGGLGQGQGGCHQESGRAPEGESGQSQGRAGPRRDFSLIDT